ncbi:ParB/RepB/Spo0J family partition protein [Aureimonas fodinaquatilis]|uniref:ParB/RepB/Spo0J family partition protein n=1 Tax=Aureimonas fodinaquatilis TaxID=2565783 RepID=A0A5B0DRS5_9HYPH|nr:ParB/RepB/Spo0J family partition protein [Aureimonas fodinaquatilis]KAA0968240.1 ParB/RepB/Spo0J family partition protein [Aureimonas fodinaquatilis]
MREEKSRARLGRGLASLIGNAPSADRVTTPFSVNATAAVVPGEAKAPVASLVPNPKNPRRSFNQDELAELTASVRVHGVVQPILVRRIPGMDSLEIVAGERRWRAAQAAGLVEVPIVEREISDRESLEIAIIENVQRADLNAIEEALGYEMLIDEHGYTQSDLADIVGKSRSHVANTLRLLKLPETVRGMVERGELAPGAARSAVSVDDPELFARQVVAGGMSVRDAEKLARGESVIALPQEKGRKARTKADTSAKDEDTKALERLLSEALSMPVSIGLQGQAGQLVLNFRNLEQLDEICRLLQAGSAYSPATE